MDRLEAPRGIAGRRLPARPPARSPVRRAGELGELHAGQESELNRRRSAALCVSGRTLRRAGGLLLRLLLLLVRRGEQV